MDVMPKKPSLNEEVFYTYEDYCRINDEKRREIINGVIYLMSPGVNMEHQIISVKLVKKIDTYLEGKKCQVFHAPFDVRLPQEGETKKTASTVVQPDIFVVCDKSKLDRRGCFGSPDLIVEILSPSTSKRDMTEKFNLYQEHKVLEYWIVDPLNQIIDRFSLNNDTGKYTQAEKFFRDDAISPTIFPGFTIRLEEVFPPLDEYEDNEDD